MNSPQSWRLRVDMVLELGELDPQMVFFEPIQRSLEQYKAAKTISKCVSFFCYVVIDADNNYRKLIKRVEDLIQDSSALKTNVAPQLKALSNLVSELVNFGIQVRDRHCDICTRMANLSSSFSWLNKQCRTYPMPKALKRHSNSRRSLTSSTMWHHRRSGRVERRFPRPGAR